MAALAPPLTQLTTDALTTLLARPGVCAIDFTAQWCGPCKAMAPLLAALNAEYARHARIVAIDVDAEPAAAARFDVRSMPTLVLVRDGREVGRVIGARSRAFVAGMLDRAIAGDLAIAGPR